MRPDPANAVHHALRHLLSASLAETAVAERMGPQAPVTLRVITNDGADLLVADDRHRANIFARLGIKGETLAVQLAHARLKEASAARRGRAGHWTYSFNEHVGLKQAAAALERLAGEGK